MGFGSRASGTPSLSSSRVGAVEEAVVVVVGVLGVARCRRRRRRRRARRGAVVVEVEVARVGDRVVVVVAVAKIGEAVVVVVGIDTVADAVVVVVEVLAVGDRVVVVVVVARVWDAVVIVVAVARVGGAVVVAVAVLRVRDPSSSSSSSVTLGSPSPSSSPKSRSPRPRPRARSRRARPRARPRTPRPPAACRRPRTSLNSRTHRRPQRTRHRPRRRERDRLRAGSAAGEGESQRECEAEQEQQGLVQAHGADIGRMERRLLPHPNEDPSLARLSARRHGLQRLHPCAGPRVDTCRPRGDSLQPGAAARAVRPRRGRSGFGRTSAGCCRSSSTTATRATRSSSCRTARAPSWRSGSSGTLPRCGSGCPPTSSSRTMCCSVVRSRRRAGRRYAVKAHGSELEYSLRGNEELAAWARESLSGAEAVFVGSGHIREVLEDVVGQSRTCTRCRPASMSRSGGRAAPRRGARRPARGSQPRSRSTPATRARRLPDEANAERFADFPGRRTSRPSCISASFSTTRASTSCSRRLGQVDARTVIVGFGDYRERAGGACGPTHALHGPARAPPPRPPARARRRDGRPSIFPEAFGMVAAEAAAAGSPPLVARHSGLAEIAEGLEQEYPAASPPPGRLR